MANLDSVRATLQLIKSAQPTRTDLMFPDYHNSAELCVNMHARMSSTTYLMSALFIIKSFTVLIINATDTCICGRTY